MERIRVAHIDDVREGAFVKVNTQGRKVLLTKVNGQFAALENRCPHLGLPLARGKICDGMVTCPFHGSSFDLLTGENIDWTRKLLGMPVPSWTQKMIAFGKAPQPVETFPVECEGEDIYIKL